MSPLSPWSILLIVVLILVLFGRNKISGMMGELGKGITSFKKGLKEGDVEEKPAPKKVASAEKKKPAAKKKTTAKKS